MLREYKKHANRKTYSKKAVKALLIVGVINGCFPYILSLLDKEPVAEMGIAWVTEIVAVILGYLCKSYFETKAERKQDLADYRAVKEETEKEDEIYG